MLVIISLKADQSSSSICLHHLHTYICAFHLPSFSPVLHFLCVSFSFSIFLHLYTISAFLYFITAFVVRHSQQSICSLLTQWIQLLLIRCHCGSGVAVQLHITDDFTLICTYNQVEAAHTHSVGLRKTIASVSSCAYPLHWNGLALPSLLLCTSFHLFVSLSHRKPLLSIWSSSQISLFLKFEYPSTVFLCSHYLPLNPFQCLSIHCYIHTPLAISSLTDLESSTVLQSPSVPVVVITDWCWSAWNSINRQQGIPKPSNV